MAARRRRKPPLQDAIEHVVKAQDKTAELDVKYINAFKGTVCVFILYIQGPKLEPATCNRQVDDLTCVKYITIFVLSCSMNPAHLECGALLTSPICGQCF